MTDSPRGTITNAIKLLVAATAVLYVVIALLVVYVYLEARSTTDSICTFRDDLQTRIDNSHEFLREHPQGIPGIPVGTIKVSVAGQEKTLKSLSGLRCPPSIFHP